jgi:trans-aconitate methyltransferase
LFRHTPSLLERIRFFCVGHDFIGAEIRYSHFKKALRHIPKISRAFDAGCGTGDFSFYLAEHFPSVAISAYDMNEETIKKNIQTQQKM